MDVALRLAPFFLLIACGVIAARTRRIELPGARALSTYVFWIAAPALLIHSLATTPAPDARMGLGLAAYSVGLLAVLAVIILAGRLLGWTREERAGAGCAAMAGNIPFLSVPFALSLFGPTAAGPVAALLAVDSLVIVPVVAAVLRSASGEESWLHAARASLANPLVISPLIGAVMAYAGLRFVQPVDDVVAVLASTASPVGLVALGVVVGLEFGTPAPGDATPVLAAMAGKLVLAPALVWFATGFSGVSAEMRAVATLFAAAPTAVHIFIQTRTLDVHAKGAATGVVMSTIAAAVTLTVLGGLLVAWLP
jgi:predicted permease